MSELITRTAKLVPYAKRPKQVPSFVTVHTYEPMPGEPAAPLGNLYVVIEVLIAGRPAEETANLVIEAFGEHYYDQPELGGEPLSRFETAVKATNRELTEYVNQGNAAWIGKLSAVVAVQAGAELHIAQTGSAEGFLYRGAGSTRITGDTPNRATGPGKTFGSIASGQLEPGDRLLLATPALVHQLPLTKLHHVATSSQPANAIHEITELLRHGSVERIAALIIEATTPERAAMQIRSEQPSEIQLGAPETPLEVAKLVAAPLADATAESTRRLSTAAKAGWRQAQPKAQQWSQAARRQLSQLSLGGSTGRSRQRPAPTNNRLLPVGPAKVVAHVTTHKRVVLAGLAVVAVLVGVIGWSQIQNQQLAGLQHRYQAAYKSYSQANRSAAGGQGSAARSQLVGLKPELASLMAASGRSQLDAYLRTAKLTANAPRSVAALQTAINQQLDELDGLKTVSPTTVVAPPQGSQWSQLQLVKNLAYVLDAAHNNSLYVVNITTNSATKLPIALDRIGEVTATSLSSNNDGLYLLTKEPAIWLYRFGDNSLTRQTTGLGGWTPGRSLASYMGNLYLLGDDGIYKYLRTYSGFGARSNYMTTAHNPELAGASALAVDGSVYVATDGGLRQYLAGTLKQTATIPSGLGRLNQLHSVAGGDTLLGVSATANRLALWQAGGELKLNHQYRLNGFKILTDAAYNAGNNTVYALADGRLVRFTP